MRWAKRIPPNRCEAVPTVWEVRNLPVLRPRRRIEAGLAARCPKTTFVFSRPVEVLSKHHLQVGHDCSAESPKPLSTMDLGNPATVRPAGLDRWLQRSGPHETTSCASHRSRMALPLVDFQLVPGRFCGRDSVTGSLPLRTLGDFWAPSNFWAPGNFWARGNAFGRGGSRAGRTGTDRLHPTAPARNRVGPTHFEKAQSGTSARMAQDPPGLGACLDLVFVVPSDQRLD